MIKIKLGSIYKISVGDYYYVGCSVDTFGRWSAHYTDIVMGKHSSNEFMTLFMNTDITEWRFEILEYVSKTNFKKESGLKGEALDTAFRRHLLIRERHWMSLHSINFCLNKDKKYFSK